MEAAAGVPSEPRHGAAALDSYNYFVQVGIKKVLKTNSEVKSDVDRVGMPSAEYGMAEKCDEITPHRCRLSNIMYS